MYKRQDIYNLQILDPVALEAEFNNIVGVVTVGLFARQPADVLLLGTADGVRTPVSYTHLDVYKRQ